MLTLLLACGSPTPPPLAEQLEPLETTNLAPEDPDRPEQVLVVTGEDQEANHHWAHARSWLHSDVAVVWTALRDLDVMADRRAVDSYSLADENNEPDYDYSFVVDNRVQDLIALQFDLTWVHQEQPERVLARWDKTDGTTFIDLLSGTVELVQIEPGVTELRCISHLRASGRDATGMEQYWRDLHADLRAEIAGDPLPPL